MVDGGQGYAANEQYSLSQRQIDIKGDAVDLDWLVGWLVIEMIKIGQRIPKTSYQNYFKLCR